MFRGAHVVLYSGDAEADRVFLRDQCGFAHLDAGEGWLIFALPPAEVAVHPAEGGGTHEMFLTVDDIDKVRAALLGRGVACTAPQDEGWGVLIRVTLPSGATLGVYEPRHALAHGD